MTKTWTVMCLMIDGEDVSFLKYKIWSSKCKEFDVCGGLLFTNPTCIVIALLLYKNNWHSRKLGQHC